MSHKLAPPRRGDGTPPPSSLGGILNTSQGLSSSTASSSPGQPHHHAILSPNNVSLEVSPSNINRSFGSPGYGEGKFVSPSHSSSSTSGTKKLWEEHQSYMEESFKQLDNALASSNGHHHQRTLSGASGGATTPHHLEPLSTSSGGASRKQPTLLRKAMTSGLGDDHQSSQQRRDLTPEPRSTNSPSLKPGQLRPVKSDLGNSPNRKTTGGNPGPDSTKMKMLLQQKRLAALQADEQAKGVKILDQIIAQKEKTQKERYERLLNHDVGSKSSFYTDKKKSEGISNNSFDAVLLSKETSSPTAKKAASLFSPPASPAQVKPKPAVKQQEKKKVGTVASEPRLISQSKATSLKKKEAGKAKSVSPTSVLNVSSSGEEETDDNNSNSLLLSTSPIPEVESEDGLTDTEQLSPSTVKAPTKLTMRNSQPQRKTTLADLRKQHKKEEEVASNGNSVSGFLDFKTMSLMVTNVQAFLRWHLSLGARERRKPGVSVLHKGVPLLVKQLKAMTAAQKKHMVGSVLIMNQYVRARRSAVLVARMKDYLQVKTVVMMKRFVRYQMSVRYIKGVMFRPPKPFKNHFVPALAMSFYFRLKRRVAEFKQGFVSTLHRCDPYVAIADKNSCSKPMRKKLLSLVCGKCQFSHAPWIRKKTREMQDNARFLRALRYLQSQWRWNRIRRLKRGGDVERLERLGGITDYPSSAFLMMIAASNHPSSHSSTRKRSSHHHETTASEGLDDTYSTSPQPRQETLQPNDIVEEAPEQEKEIKEDRTVGDDNTNNNEHGTRCYLLLSTFAWWPLRAQHRDRVGQEYVINAVPLPNSSSTTSKSHLLSLSTSQKISVGTSPLKGGKPAKNKKRVLVTIRDQLFATMGHYQPLLCPKCFALLRDFFWALYGESLRQHKKILSFQSRTLNFSRMISSEKDGGSRAASVVSSYPRSDEEQGRAAIFLQLWLKQKLRFLMIRESTTALVSPTNAAEKRKFQQHGRPSQSESSQRSKAAQAYYRINAPAAVLLNFAKLYCKKLNNGGGSDSQLEYFVHSKKWTVQRQAKYLMFVKTLPEADTLLEFFYKQDKARRAAQFALCRIRYIFKDFFYGEGDVGAKSMRDYSAKTLAKSQGTLGALAAPGTPKSASSLDGSGRLTPQRLSLLKMNRSPKAAGRSSSRSPSACSALSIDSREGEGSKGQDLVLELPSGKKPPTSPPTSGRGVEEDVKQGGEKKKEEEKELKPEDSDSDLELSMEKSDQHEPEEKVSADAEKGTADDQPQTDETPSQPQQEKEKEDVDEAGLPREESLGEFEVRWLDGISTTFCSDRCLMFGMMLSKQQSHNLDLNSRTITSYTDNLCSTCKDAAIKSLLLARRFLRCIHLFQCRFRWRQRLKKRQLERKKKLGGIDPVQFNEQTANAKGRCQRCVPFLEIVATKIERYRKAKREARLQQADAMLETSVSLLVPDASLSASPTLGASRMSISTTLMGSPSPVPTKQEFMNEIHGVLFECCDRCKQVVKAQLKGLR